MTSRPHLATLVEDMRQLGEHPAVVEHRGVRRFPSSYGQLARGAEWFAGELERRGIGSGERVVLWGENGAAWIACFFGCVMRGVLVVSLDATGTVEFAGRIVRETSPRLVVGDALLLRSLGEVGERLALSEVRLDGSGSAGTVAEGLGPETPLQILFTSGTTGEPKGIVHTHRNLLASLTPIEREIAKYRKYERWVHPLQFLHTLPLSHVFGQFMGLWVAPVLGAVVHYESRLEAARLLRLFKQERISVLAAVPRVLGLLRAELLRAYPELAAGLAVAQGVPIGKRWWRFRRVHGRLGWRFWAIVCGGATLAEELEGFWTTLGVALIQGYGMTETSALVTLNHPFKPARGTLGAPLPGRELRIAESGELLVRGEMVATSTWREGALRVSEGDGWLATGDLTRRDSAGRLEYLGRTGQRLVTSSGLNVYLEDVEAALAGQAGVDSAVAVVVEGPQGPEPGAVVRASDAGVAAKAVEGANARLAAHQRIGRWWLWPGLDLPRTATGKVRRGVVEGWVRERLAQESSGGSGGSGAGSAGQDGLLRLLSGVIGAEVPDGAEERTLESLGLDSLGRVQAQAAIERASGRSIDDRAMSAVRTLGELRRLAGLGAAAQLVQDETRAASEHPAAGAPETDRVDRVEAGTPAAGESFLYLRWPWAAPVEWLRNAFLEGCVRPLVWLLAGPRVEYSGVTEHQLRAEGPLLIVANHVSSYDVPLLLYALPRGLRWRVAVAAGGEMMEDWRHGRGNPLGPAIYWLLTVLFNTFPLPRSHAFRRAFAHAGEALDRGYSVLVFPEGTRSHGGPVATFRGGIGLLAQEARVRVLPMALDESRGGRGVRLFGATVHVGAIVTVGVGEEAHAVTARLEEAVRGLLDPIKA